MSTIGVHIVATVDLPIDQANLVIRVLTELLIVLLIAETKNPTLIDNTARKVLIVDVLAVLLPEVDPLDPLPEEPIPLAEIIAKTTTIDANGINTRDILHMNMSAVPMTIITLHLRLGHINQLTNLVNTDKHHPNMTNIDLVTIHLIRHLDLVILDNPPLTIKNLTLSTHQSKVQSPLHIRCFRFSLQQSLEAIPLSGRPLSERDPTLTLPRIHRLTRLSRCRTAIQIYT